MNLVFLNSFEKETEHEGAATAQVSIAEEFGEWRLWWHEPGPDGKPVQESWYTGTAWSDMLTVFRERVSEKRKDGYRPLIEFSPGRESNLARSRLVRKLQYYGERNADEELFETLRRWRNAQASREGKSPFILASNRVLKMIAAFVPKSRDELLQIPGMGEHRANLYGADLLAITAEASQPMPFPLDWVQESVSDDELEAWLREREEQRSQGESARREQREKLLEAIGKGATLGELESIARLGRRELLDRLDELDKLGYDLEPLIAAELADVPQPLIDKAWQAFGSAGDRYLRPVLKRVYDGKTLDEPALARAYEWLRLLRIRYRRTKIDVTEDAVNGKGELPERTA
jgi:hypothetical protein